MVRLNDQQESNMFNFDFARTAVSTLGTAVCAAICLLGATVPAQATDGTTPVAAAVHTVR